MEYSVKIKSFFSTRERFIPVQCIPYKVYKIMQGIERKIGETKDHAEQILALEAKNKDLKDQKPDGYKDKIVENQKRINELSKRIFEVEDSGFFDDRFEAIKIILRVNGISEDDELMEKATWEERMDYSDPMAFLEFCMSKDLKKVLAAANSMKVDCSPPSINTGDR